MEMSKNTQLGAIIIVGLILIGGIFGGVHVYNQKEAEISALIVEKTNANHMIQKKDSVVNDMENTFNEIEANLKFIKEKRNRRQECLIWLNSELKFKS